MTKPGFFPIVIFVLLAPLVFAEGTQVYLALNFASTSIDLLIEPLPQHVAYVSADPFYLDLGLGYKVYFAGKAFDQQNLAFFARAEAVYSFTNRRFDASNVAVGLETSPDGRIVGGAEIMVRPLEWGEQLPVRADWQYVLFLIPRIVAEYRIPLSW